MPERTSKLEHRIGPGAQHDCVSQRNKSSTPSRGAIYADGRLQEQVESRHLDGDVDTGRAELRRRVAESTARARRAIPSLDADLEGRGDQLHRIAPRVLANRHVARLDQRPRHRTKQACARRRQQRLEPDEESSAMGPSTARKLEIERAPHDPQRPRGRKHHAHLIRITAAPRPPSKKRRLIREPPAQDSDREHRRAPPRPSPPARLARPPSRVVPTPAPTTRPARGSCM